MTDVIKDDAGEVGSFCFDGFCFLVEEAESGCCILQVLGELRRDASATFLRISMFR
ncbi:MAG: hypothetical protein ACI9R3_001543 [Verrucomicrobiales bacterium]|jgi:hypothetical protein